jgi:hypothetical protein
MSGKKADVPCVVCNPSEAEPGDYCEAHREELHRLDHQYEGLFRLQRISRGKGHEIYELFVQGECDPSGRMMVAETDPENLAINILLSSDIDLEARISDYGVLGIEKTYADQLRSKIQQEIVHSWYGNARACVDIFRLSAGAPQHWDLDARAESSDEEGLDSHNPPGGKHSVH